MRVADIDDGSRRPFEDRGKDIPAEIRAQVLERDSYQCVVCGNTYRIQVHHLSYRSAGGGHTGINLVTLCQGCHDAVHAKRIHLIIQMDGNRPLFFVEGSRRGLLRNRR